MNEEEHIAYAFRVAIGIVILLILLMLFLYYLYHIYLTDGIEVATNIAFCYLIISLLVLTILIVYKYII